MLGKEHCKGAGEGMLTLQKPDVWAQLPSRLRQDGNPPCVLLLIEEGTVKRNLAEILRNPSLNIQFAWHSISSGLFTSYMFALDLHSAALQDDCSTHFYHLYLTDSGHHLEEWKSGHCVRYATR